MKFIQNHNHPKIQEAVMAFNCDFLKEGYSELEYYMYFLNHVSFWEVGEMEMPTCAATVYKGRLAILWTREFVEELSIKELMAILIHEIYHLIGNHLERGKGYDQRTSNIAMDMIINHLIIKYHGAHVEFPKLTKEKAEALISKNSLDGAEASKVRTSIGKSECIELDANYKGDLVFEPLYEWLQTENAKDKNGEPNELSEDTKNLMKWADRGMTLDYHVQLDEISDEIRKDLAKGASEKAKYDTQKSRGTIAGSIADILELLLKKPKENNLRLIKRMVSALKGREKVRSFKRLNRRIEGVKGAVKQSLELNVILDTSGSMDGEFDLVLSEIYRDGYVINLCQVDTRLQNVKKITSKHEFKKFAVYGLGGTTLTPGIEHIIDPKNRLHRNGTLILTDGATDCLDFHNSMGQFLIISTGSECPTQNAGPNVRQITIKR
jgi:predicted metal-dependent peptidase